MRGDHVMTRKIPLLRTSNFPLSVSISIKYYKLMFKKSRNSLSSNIPIRDLSSTIQGKIFNYNFLVKKSKLKIDEFSVPNLINYSTLNRKTKSEKEKSLQYISKLCRRIKRSIIDNVSKHFMYNFCVFL